MAKDAAYRKAEQRIEQARQKNATILNLSRMKLTEVPATIGSLSQLQELYLSNNQLREVPETIGSLSQLQQLVLSDNQLSELPKTIGSLSQLQGLDLSNNQLSAVPETIGALSQLQQLYLSNNQLSAVPETIGSLSQLQTLDLSDNQFEEVPELITRLKRLQDLNFAGNKIHLLPSEISKLKNLRRLCINENQIHMLPHALAELNLGNLAIGGNPFKEPPWEIVVRLKSLKELYFWGFSIGKIDSRIRQLSYLRILNLRQGELTQLPEEIGLLTNLKTLYLGENQLTDLPLSFGQLLHLQNLELNKNPLNPDLAAAYKQGMKAVLQYLRAKAEAQVRLFEAKLILIGEGEVGKTCLLGALRGDAWVEGRPTTHGIEIKPVRVTDPDSSVEITLNGWDFGGQRVYRPTHQLFFSAPAVYLVVWKPREGPQQGFVKEWITLIKHREPDAKVIVVATHGGPGQRQPDIDRQELLDLFSSDTVIDFFYVDSKPDSATQGCKNIDALKDAIARVAAALPEMGRSVPAKWQRVQEILQNSDRPYMSYNEVMALCSEQGIDPEQADLFVRISHTLGHLIHYHYDPTLRDIVILKPDWLAKAISFVLDDETTRRRNGLVEFQHLSQLWSHPPFPDEAGYPEALHPVFLRLMERFDLSYKVVLNPANHEAETTSLIAQLVPDNRPAHLPDWGEQPQVGDRQQVQICRIVDDRGQAAVAEGLFYQLIVRLHKYSLGRNDYHQSVHWQRGLMLDNDYNGRALLEHTGTDVKITVRAAYPERFLAYLTEEVKWLVESFWEGLHCNVMVPCIAPCGKNQPGHGLFEVQKLIESKKKQRHEYPCPISSCGEWQPIDQLLNNAPTAPSPSQEFDIEQFRRIVKDELVQIRRDLVVLDRRANDRAHSLSQGFQALSQEQRTILSQVDQQLAYLMQMLVDEAKEGPRLFSFKPIEPGFFDRPKWISAKFQLTLWCEHAHKPLPVLNQGSKQGVYELSLPREWFVKAVPYLKLLTNTLSLIVPVAGSTTKLLLDDTDYKNIEEELDLAQKSIESTLKGSEIVTNWQTESESSNWGQGDAIRAHGATLRELHALLKQKDPGFGGLVRVQNKRREFLWVHPQFVEEY